MKGKFLPLLLPALLLFSSSTFSQLITGRVLSESGLAAPAVTVQFVNQSVSVQTIADGTFSIMAARLPDTLIFSSVGYESYKVRVTEKTVKDKKFEVVLLSSRSALSEVVVVGYGSSKKKDVTGSVSTVSGVTDFERSITKAEAVSGRLAGASVTGPEAHKSLLKVRGAADIYGYASPSGEELKYESRRKLAIADSIGSRGIGQSYRARQITAGEINDFNKWKMWEDFTESEFKLLSKKWNLFPKRRYCVQLQNMNHSPLIGQIVFLINPATKDTLWTARTDNTGKAELWAGVDQEKLDDQVRLNLASPGFEPVSNALVFEKGINRMHAVRDCDQRKAVDIAFVVDATGSMGDEIEFLKLELEDVLRKTFDRFAEHEIRAASVFYRDNGDEYLTRQVLFNNDLLKVLNFVKLQSAGGGGDTPEAVETALSAAVDSLSWNSEAITKIIFLVLDAPPHNGTEPRMFSLIRKAAAKGIRIVPIVCSGADKSTEYLMRSLALTTNGRYVFLTDHSGIGNSHLKPTTDVYDVELLNSLLQRLIAQMIFTTACPNQKNPVAFEPELRLPANILSVKVAPNPTTGPVVIRSNRPLKDIFIADFSGKILVRLAGGSKTERWETDLSQFPSGTYLVKYITTENEWGAEKVILAR